MSDRSPPPSSDDPARTLRVLVAGGRFRDALEAHRALDDDATRARGEVQLHAATAATRLGDLDLAGSLAASAEEGFRARGDADGRMRAANLLGAIAFERGRVDDAERCFEDARRLAHGLGDQLLGARTANNLASVAHLRGDPERALSLYRAALLQYQRLGDRRGTAETHHNLGLAFRVLAKWREADAATAEALRHAELVGEGSLIALALLGRAELHLDQGEQALAASEVARAERIAADAHDEYGRAEAGRLRALLHLRERDFGRALAAAEAAAELAVAHQSALLAAECQAAAALALRGLDRPDAGQRRDAAVRALEGLGATAVVERLQRDWESLGATLGESGGT